jgi:xanthine dehydrogenase accessory factor
MVDAEGLPVPDWSDAMVLTPGGGRIGSIAGGALDGQLADLAGRWNVGRLVRFEVSEIDALIAGLPTAGSARCLVVPADTFPGELWEMAAARQPLCLVCRIEGDEVAQISLYSAENVGDASPVVEQLFQAGASGSTLIDDEVITVLRPVSQLVIVGDTPVGDALAELASLVGWKTRVFNDAASATGVIATLSQLDKVVVTAHDLDLAGAALMAALESQVGYIGALGAHRMQENRADWLAYRGVTDLSRIHGPAGFDIGAETPSEIAVSILAEAIGAGVADRVSD